MRFLLCTDGSQYGQAALRYGALFARASSEPATLLGVLEHPAERRQLEEALAEGRKWLADAPPPEVRVRAGHPAEEILDEASRGHYDLLVVGARGRRGITRFMLGSTTERIARHSRVPVLIVRGWHPAIEKMLVCTAAGEPGMAVIGLSGKLAALVGAEVTVLHVMSQVPAEFISTRYLDDLEARADELMAHGTAEGQHLKQALTLLADMGVSARAIVRHGLVVDEIKVEACEKPYDLVVVGTHITAGWMRFLLEDVTRQVFDCVSGPILIAKTGAMPV